MCNVHGNCKSFELTVSVEEGQALTENQKEDLVKALVSNFKLKRKYIYDMYFED